MVNTAVQLAIIIFLTASAWQNIYEHYNHYNSCGLAMIKTNSVLYVWVHLFNIIYTNLAYYFLRLDMFLIDVYALTYAYKLFIV